MSQYWILAAILLPMMAGIGVKFIPFQKKQHFYIF